MRCSTVLPVRKCFKIQSILLVSLVFTVVLVFHQIDRSASDQFVNEESFPTMNIPSIPTENLTCQNQTEFPSDDYLRESIDLNDTRPRPTVSRLESLFAKLISYENKFRTIFQHLGIFRWTELSTSLQPYANQSQRFPEIFCLFQRYLSQSNRTHLQVPTAFVDYLRKVSNYLSEGFTHLHSSWTDASVKSQIVRPVIVLAANSRFYDTLQSSMRTVDRHFANHTVVIYDLGFNSIQLRMIETNCPRCLIIPFPFALFDSVASHIRTLSYFAWKPIVIQDALRRFGSIIYGDTSVRYRTSNVDRLLIDNLLRGFACRELPGHYLPCFTQEKTFQWFNESPSDFDEIYIAEAGFLAVTDTFLSRLILKTWITCALDSQCIAPTFSHTTCRRLHGSFQTHRFDQSAMATLLSFYFYPSRRQGEKTHPAPYDMYASIQEQIAEVRRFEGDDSYFTRKAS